jgi:hypothetical protein
MEEEKGYGNSLSPNNPMLCSPYLDMEAPRCGGGMVGVVLQLFFPHGGDGGRKWWGGILH